MAILFGAAAVVIFPRTLFVTRHVTLSVLYPRTRKYRPFLVFCLKHLSYSFKNMSLSAVGGNFPRKAGKETSPNFNIPAKKFNISPNFRTLNFPLRNSKLLLIFEVQKRTFMSDFLKLPASCQLSSLDVIYISGREHVEDTISSLLSQKFAIPVEFHCRLLQRAHSSIPKPFSS